MQYFLQLRRTYSNWNTDHIAVQTLKIYSEKQRQEKTKSGTVFLTSKWAVGDNFSIIYAINR